MAAIKVEDADTKYLNIPPHGTVSCPTLAGGDQLAAASINPADTTPNNPTETSSQYPQNPPSIVAATLSTSSPAPGFMRGATPM